MDLQRGVSKRKRKRKRWGMMKKGRAAFKGVETLETEEELGGLKKDHVK